MDSENRMYFNSICTKNWCFFGAIEITGEGDDDFKIVQLKIVRHACWADVLGLVDRDIMAELLLILKDFRRRPEKYDEEPLYE